MANDSFVYFARVGNSPFVKIGRTRCVKKRMKALQTAHAQPIRAILTLPGGDVLEGQLHNRFREHRVRGEWFRLCDEIKTYIRRNGGPVYILDAWRGEATDDDVRDAIERAQITRLSPSPTKGPSHGHG